MSPSPWNSIAESLVNFEEVRLGYPEALSSPCSSCPTAPCCTHLPLQTFKITNMLELDHALYVLNFDRIELGLSAAGEWSIYYTYPCRFLNRKDFSCTVHNSPAQPQICVHYNPYQCWYKRVFTKSFTEDFLRIDRQRMAWVVQHIVFDEARNIVAVPDWEFLSAELAKLPLEPNPRVSEPPATDPVFEAWQELALGSNGTEAKPPDPGHRYHDLQEPCLGCQAYCCQTLVFPQALPGHITNLDFFRFCLGFPGIELGISADAWSLVVKTTCRHLQDQRCALFGQPERPLICKYYDGARCTYKVHFGLPRPAGYLRVKLEQFEWLTENFQFDRHGAITAFPALEGIRSHIETKWHEGAARPVMS